MNTDLEKLSEQLDALTLGQRAWFWLCPGVETLPLVLLAPFRSDPLVIALRERVKGARIPAGASPMLGLCVVGEDGVFRFASTSMTEETLGQLAAWVRDNAEAHPALRRLYGAQMLLVDEHMNVQLTISDPAAWEGVEPTMVPGSIAETIQTVHTLALGERAWFWATDCGPGREPFLLVEPIVDGARVRDLNRRVEGALLRSPERGATVRGVIACGRDGRLSVSTQASERKARTVFKAIGAQHRLLRWMLRPRALPEDDLFATAAVLADLQDHDLGWFFFALRPREGELVLLDTEKGSLKAQMKAAGVNPSQGTVGRFRVRGERVELAVEDNDPTLLPSIARWIAQSQHRHAALRRLVGARFVVLDENDDVVARVESERAWASLSTMERANV